MNSDKRIRVLIADDSPPVCAQLAALLGDLENVDVVGTAADALQAVDEIQSLLPDVVILDIQMPSGGGINVLRWAQLAEIKPKFIMLTNYAYAQYRKVCLKAGASYFFDKSSEFDMIPQALQQLSGGAPGTLASS